MNMYLDKDKDLRRKTSSNKLGKKPNSILGYILFYFSLLFKGNREKLTIEANYVNLMKEMI